MSDPEAASALCQECGARLDHDLVFCAQWIALRAEIAALRSEIERLQDLKEMYLKKYDEQFARADAAEAHAKELYEESLDMARRHKKEIDGGEL